ncbi:MAG: hypothetical protein AAGD28_27100 [Bacteroidota bacterium]
MIPDSQWLFGIFPIQAFQDSAMIRVFIFSFLLLNAHGYAQDLYLVEAGKGFEEVKLGESDMKVIQQTFGKKYKVSKSWRVACGMYRCNFSTSTWVQYKSGLSLYFYESEAPKGKRRIQGSLREIEINRPFHVETKEGINLIKTSYEDLIKLKGGAEKLSIKENLLIAYYNGIEFYFESTSTSNKNLSYTDFLDAPLIRITITKKESS